MSDFRQPYLDLVADWGVLCDAAGVEGDSSVDEIIAAFRAATPAAEAGLDEALAALRVAVEDMPEPTLGLKGGVSRLGVLSLIDATLVRSAARLSSTEEPKE